MDSSSAALISSQSAAVSAPLAAGADKGKGRAEAPVTQPNLDPTPGVMARVLEIVPDVEATYLFKLVQRHLSAVPVAVDEEQDDGGVAAHEHALQAVLHILFENQDYPRASKKRKRTDSDDDAGPAKTRKIEEVDYGSKDRVRTGSKYYDELALVSYASLQSHVWS